MWCDIHTYRCQHYACHIHDASNVPVYWCNTRVAIVGWKYHKSMACRSLEKCIYKCYVIAYASASMTKIDFILYLQSVMACYQTKGMGNFFFI